MNKTILVVDDEEDLLDIMHDFLTEEGYSVHVALNAEQALAKLSQQSFDLMVSDINMPGKKGYELCAIVKKEYPLLTTALMTAYDVRDYISMAKEFDIGNIITKTTPFNFDEVGALIATLLSKNVFGLARYVNGKINTLRIKNSDEIEAVMHKILDWMQSERDRRKFRAALGEILINAVYYGAQNERGDRKDVWKSNVDLAPHEEIVISYGCDGEKVGVAVTDQRGRLTKKDVLYWLERNTTRGEDGLAVGLFDEHGRGLYISRESIDRFIVNIKPTITTEVVMLNYSEGLYDGSRPLWIYEM